MSQTRMLLTHSLDVPLRMTLRSGLLTQYSGKEFVTIEQDFEWKIKRLASPSRVIPATKASPNLQFAVIVDESYIRSFRNVKRRKVNVTVIPSTILCDLIL